MGALAAEGADLSSPDALRRAMAYGTALASFNVEEFGTERVSRLTGEEIAERVAALARMTTFEHTPTALRTYAQRRRMLSGRPSPVRRR